MILFAFTINYQKWVLKKFFQVMVLVNGEKQQFLLILIHWILMHVIQKISKNSVYVKRYIILTDLNNQSTTVKNLLNPIIKIPKLNFYSLININNKLKLKKYPMILYVMVINQNKKNLMMFLKVLVLVNGKKHKDQNIMNGGIFMHVFQLISIKIANVVQKKNLIDRMFLFISVKNLKNYKIKIN